MKILRIALKNLASIEGEFFIDLEKDPILGKADLFAITGKTGAGKTTILDAICLALYGKTPRYETSRKVGGEIGGLKIGDVRNLLRRGSVSCYAEVSFRGKDSKEYKARWELSKGKMKIDGVVKDAKRSLCLVIRDGSIEQYIYEEGRQSEIKEKIEKVVGMSFEQFCHAVLLAQGQFQAFLEANPGDRSALLEALTGTEIYTEISKKAHEKNKRYSDELKLIDSGISQKRILEPSLRIELDNIITTLKSNKNEYLNRKKQIELAIDWYKDTNILISKISALSDEIKNIETIENKEVTPNERGLSLWEKLGNARLVWDQIIKNKFDTEELEKTILKTSNEVENLKLEEIKKRDLKKIAEEEYQIVISRNNLIKIDCEKAKDLDTKIKIRTVSLLNLKKEKESIESELANLKKESEKIKKIIEDNEFEKNNIETELLKFKNISHILKDIKPITKDISRLEELKKKKEIEIVLIEEIKINQEKQKQQLDNLLFELKTLEKEKDIIKNELDEKSKDASNYDIESLRKQEKSLIELKVSTENAHQDYKQLNKLESELATLSFNIEKQNNILCEKKLEKEGIKSKIEKLNIIIDEQKSRYQQFSLALGKDISKLRSIIKDDSPCPVCGSLDHPYLYNELLPQMAEELVIMKKDIENFEKTLAESINVEKSIDHTISESFSTINIYQETSSKLKKECEFSKKLLSNFKSKQNIYLEVENIKWNDILEEINLKIDSIEKEIAKITSLDNVIKKQNLELQKIETDISARRTEIESSQNKLQETYASITEKTLSEKELSTQINELLKMIELQFSQNNFEENIESNPLAFLKKLTNQSTDYIKKQNQIDAINLSLQSIVIEATTIEFKIKSANEANIKTQGDIEVLSGTLEIDKKERKDLIDGADVKLIEDKMQKDGIYAQEKVDIEAKRLIFLVEELRKIEGNLESQVDHIKKLELEKIVLEENLSHILTNSNIEKSEMIECFSRDNEFYRSIQKKKNELSDKKSHLLGQKATLLIQLDQYKENSPQIEYNLCQNEIAEINFELERTNFELDIKIKEQTFDELRISEATELRKKRQEIANSASSWQQIAEVIGSSDGKKFRTYAQGVNLRTLIAYSNWHLKQLRPRYQLRQHEDELMEIVIVDCDMAGTIRSVKSLSGGESFLVSLSLALGLSNMAARDLSIDSLFIDEGFGTLDSESLNLVLSVLQGLHAQGKKVGIITHVEGIAEQVDAEVHVSSVSPGKSHVIIRSPTADYKKV